jgi:hypothetical protein
VAGSPENLALKIQIDGMRETLAAISKLEKDASKELRKETLQLSRLLSRRIRAAGNQRGGQAAALAPTVKARFDRVPSVIVGGKGAVGRHRTSARDLLIGSEFGHSGQGGKGIGTRNFAPHGFRHRNSPRGWWIYPTVAANQDEIARTWQSIADRIVTKFGGG